MNSAPENVGVLEFLSIAGILKDLFRKRATSELSLSVQGITKKVFFKNGLIIYATSTLERDSLGNVLREHGFISGRQYDESMRQAMAAGKRQGTLLVQMGFLTPRDLFRGLALQVREIILSLFAWERGTYRLTDRLPPQGEIVTLRIQPALMVYEGVASRAAKRKEFRRHWDLKNLRLFPRTDAPWPLEDLRLPPEGKKLLSHLERGTPLEQIPPAVGLGADDTAAFLYTLAVFDQLSASPSGGPSSRPSRGIGEEAEAPMEGAEEPTLPSREKIEGQAKKILNFNLYQVLRLEPGAGSASIKAAYLSLAKEFHPDRFFGDAYEDLREQVTVIFMRINEAYTVLSNPRKREEYDRREIRCEVTSREKLKPDQDSRVAREQYRKGLDLLKAGDPWAAAESFRWAVHLNPGNPLHHTWLGASLARTRKRLHEAEEHCKTAITLDYSNPFFHLHLGQVYKAGKLPRKARKEFETALKLDRNLAAARTELENLEAPAEGKGVINRIFGK